MLAHLNGYDQEDEWGETFRKIGKTDIQIETEKRAVFMAACTVWRDSKAISDSIDQLLSHLMWRDCKAAMMIFNKDEPSFSEILKKLMCVSGG